MEFDKNTIIETLSAALKEVAEELAKGNDAEIRFHIMPYKDGIIGKILIEKKEVYSYREEGGLKI